ncbi:FG-GAP-like repeat-containing protein, partial [Chondromyces apiculatus]|uniref:FG-GAP-like repeat-containing protein n=1 Tax=Chondromyces apiculatus TaxID=51 RepID=UPI000694DBCC
MDQPSIESAQKLEDEPTIELPPEACPEVDESLFPEHIEMATAEAGTLAGTFSASKTGEAHYSIPLPIPPGRAGVQPTLSIEYNSGSGEGSLGMGFTIGGLSAITRCPRNMELDGVVEGVEDTVEDPLCLDGVRLVGLTDPGDPDAGLYAAEYRTRPDTFTKIVTDVGREDGWALDKGPRSFTAYTKAGLIMEYGRTTNSQVLARGGVVRSWLLNRISDRHGNTVDYSYLNDVHGTEGYTIAHEVEKIDYTGHPNAPPSRSIVFSYENTFNKPPRYARGMKFDRQRRLESITMLAPTPVRSIGFSYTTGAATGRALLESIEECAGGTCKPPTRFFWHSEGSPSFTPLNTGLDAPLSPGGSVMTLDMTGDGLDDILMTDADGAGTTAEDIITNWLFAPNVSQEIAPAFYGARSQIYQLGHPGASVPIQPELGTPIDYNQDGLMDILVHDTYAIDANWRVLLTNPSGGFTSVNTGVAHPFYLPPLASLVHPTASAHLADVDGDGVSDLIQCKDEGTNEYVWTLHRWRPSPQGFSTTGQTIADLARLECNTELYTVDIDADGKVELVVHELLRTSDDVAQLNDLEALSYTGSNDWSHMELDLPAPSEGRLIFLDLNADGLPDALAGGYTDSQPYTFMNTGAGFSLPVASFPSTLGLPSSVVEPNRYINVAVPIDIDVDGRQDLLIPMGGASGLPSWTVLRSRGDGTFSLFNPNLPTEVVLFDGAAPTLWDPHSPRLTDLDGDGVQDLLLVINDKIRAFKNALHNEDLLVGVVDGLAPRNLTDPDFRPRVAIEYGSLVDLHATTASSTSAPPAESRSYLAGRTSSAPCEYPVRCVVGPKQVVTGYQLDAGVAEPRHFQVVYRDGRYHRLGLGFLGFRTRIVRDLDKGSGIVETYDNRTYDGGLHAFPFAGQIVNEVRYTPSLSFDGNPGDGALELRHKTVLRLPAPTFGGRSFYTVPALSTEQRAQDQYNASGGLTLEAAALQPSGNLVALGFTRRGITDYDAFGNVLSEFTSTPGAEELTITRTVSNDDARWLIGKVGLLTECSTAGSMTQCRKTARWHNAVTGDVLAQVASSADDDPETWIRLLYWRDSFGNIVATRARVADGTVREGCTRYDAEGLFPAVERNPAQHVTRFNVDKMGLLTGRLDAEGRLTRFIRDGFGRLTREMRSDGTDTTYTLSRVQSGGPLHDEWSLELTTFEQGRRRDKVQYDSLGRAVRWWKEGVQLATPSVPRIFEEIHFDAFGENVAWKSIPHADPAPPGPPPSGDTYFHDGTGRVVRHITPWGAETTYAYEGSRTTVTRPGDVTTITRNDALGRPAEIRDNADGTTTYAYGPFGGLRDVTDPEGHKTTTERDAYGRVRRSVDPDRGETIFSYNGFGDQTGSRDALGREIELQHDPLGRVVRRTDDDGVTLFRWDTAAHGKGQLAEVESPDGHQTTYRYDTVGRLDQTTLTVGSEQFVTGFGYDAYGRLKTTTYPSTPGLGGFTVQNEYDAYGHLLAVHEPATGNLFWLLEQVDQVGRIEIESMGSGVATTTRTYDDERDRVATIRTDAGSGVLQELAYLYDDRQNLERRIDNRQGATESFRYDDLDRLTCAQFIQIPTCTAPYRYSDSGNLLHHPTVGEITYDPQGQPHAALTAGNDSFVYDAVGNQIERPGADITYTAFNLPKTIVRAQGGNVSFAYDGLGQRIRKTTPTKETIYVGDLYERVTATPSGGVEHRYKISSSERVIAILTRRSTGPEQLRFLHTDALGSVDVVTDDAGVEQERRSYSAFGIRRQVPGTTSAPFTWLTNLGFTGHEDDDELGLVNMKGRIYDPKLGRFLTPDPVVAQPWST